MKIDEMLEKYCKNGVKFYKLDEIVDFLNGKGHEKNIVENGRYIVVNSKFISTDGDTKKFSNEQTCPVYKDDILMVMSDLPNGRALAKCFYVEDDDKYTLNQRICALRVKDKDLINTRFLYYYSNRNSQLLRYDNGVDQTNLKKDDILNIRVAVPPLEVQCEIVHILDDFTLLSAELSAELKARQKQYEYYENELFDFDNNNIEYTKIDFEEIATFSQGIQVDVNKQYYEPFENRVPFLRIVDFVNDNEPPRYIEKPNDKYIKKENEMIMIRYGASAAGKVFLNKYGAIANNMFKINLKEKSSINLKYLMYYLSQNKIYKLLNSSGKSTMPAINFGFLGKLKIDIPSIKEQERIVNTLDRFDKLCNDISEGLPAEIEARQKQYEYYRDKLLTFKELKVNE